jgi:pyruvate-formate lyase-activating enzyme
MTLRTKDEQKAFLDGYESCAECINKYLSDDGKKKLECLLVVVRNTVKNAAKIENIVQELRYDAVLEAIENAYDMGMSEKEQILDKIRAEIKALSPEPTAYDVVDGNPIKDAVWETIADVLKIIDKYRAESEDEK